MSPKDTGRKLTKTFDILLEWVYTTGRTEDCFPKVWQLCTPPSSIDEEKIEHILEDIGFYSGELHFCSSLEHYSILTQGVIALYVHYCRPVFACALVRMSYIIFPSPSEGAPWLLVLFNFCTKWKNFQGHTIFATLQCIVSEKSLLHRILNWGIILSASPLGNQKFRNKIISASPKYTRMVFAKRRNAFYLMDCFENKRRS